MKLNGEVLVLELYRHGYTQTMLAKKAGLSRPTVNNAARGFNTSEKSAAAMANVLGVPIDKLVLLDGQTA